MHNTRGRRTKLVAKSQEGEAHMIEKLYKIAEGLNARFPDGNNPFMIATRLLEECGEVAEQINLFEGKGVKQQKLPQKDRAHFAKELQDVMRAILSLALYYDLKSELTASVEEFYRRVVAEGLVEPIGE